MHIIQEPYDSIIRVCNKYQFTIAKNPRDMTHAHDMANEIWEIVKEYGVKSHNQQRRGLDEIIEELDSREGTGIKGHREVYVGEFAEALRAIRRELPSKS